ncbi:Chaperone DnaJ-domain superfamily protein [Rhynchospora pubera]|uniref:Chaperone DnaJ-domain superfamily protein n=1 Tax=Rhynchospora pubera TaxID=906938 RepID=A0AAV8D1D5_9POAL|nr:Chaperone DnaJ-domain superfamily protein [Rhynchospora pubera]
MNSGDGGGGPRRQEAERWLGVAGKLLEARDFEGCKQFVEQSVSADPLVPGAEELVAAAEVLQSVKQHRINDHPDYYAVLGLDSSLPSSLEPAAVSLHYQRLSLLLHRDPPTPAFTDAAKLVADAWAVLSDPASKALFDKELELSKPKPKPAPPSPPPPPPASSPPRKMPVKRAKSPTLVKPLKSVPPKGGSSAKLGKSVAKPSNFWTMCTTCCHVHQYGRLCEGQYLLCHSCRRPFFAAAMLEPPTVVPDTDMYYCTWGFFPLGFPGGPGYGGMYGLGSQFGSGSVPAAGPGLIPPKKGRESVKAIGSGTPNSLSVKRGRGRPRKIQPSSGTPATPGSDLVNVIGTGLAPGSQLNVISPKIGENPKDIFVSSGIGSPNSLSVKRGRGRPRKHQPSPATPAIPESSLVDVPVVGNVPAVILPSMGHESPPKDAGTSSVVFSPSSVPMKRGRGRPRKNEANSASTSQKMVAKKRVNANLKKVVVDMN